MLTIFYKYFFLNLSTEPLHPFPTATNFHSEPFLTKSAKWKASHPAPFSASTYLHISFPVSLFTTLMYASFTSEKVFLPSPKNLNIFAYRAIFCRGCHTVYIYES